jgi:putative cell wall-binding protein
LASLATSLVVGVCVAGAGPASAAASFQFDRIQGDDRYGTSAKTADEFGSADTVILASGAHGHYADALTANYLAGLKDAPILLTKANSTPTEVQDAIKKTGAGKIIIVGGTGVISQAQQEELAKSYKVTRIAGHNRYGTAAQIIDQGDEAQGDTALLATGQDFPDALGAGPVAFSEHMPLAITKADDVPDNVLNELQKAGVTDIVILGGEDVVGKAVVSELENKGFTVTDRVSGEDRAETSAKFAEYAMNHYGFKNTAVNVASGYTNGDGADALAGAALSGQQSVPMLITKSEKNAGDAVLAYLKDHAETLRAGDASGGATTPVTGDSNIFGGPGAVNTDTELDLNEAVLGSGAYNADTGALYDDAQTAIADAKEGAKIIVFGEADRPLNGFALSKNLTIVGDDDSAVVSGAIAISGVTDATVSGLTVTPGNIQNALAGFYLDNTKGLTISDNVVKGSGGSPAQGAGVINTTGGTDEEATISGNTFRDLLQGTYANPSAKFTIDSNKFVNNTAGSANDAASTITNNAFLNNDEGVGLGVAGATVTGNSFANQGQDHVGDYTTDSSYDLAKMIDDNHFDEDVVVTPQQDGAGPEFIKDADQVTAPSAQPTQ